MTTSVAVNWDDATALARAYDPIIWAEEVAGVKLWSGQKKVLRSVRDNRRTAVGTCHRWGKGFSAAVLIGWWKDRFLPEQPMTLTSAPGTKLVKAIIWREFGRLHSKIKKRIEQGKVVTTQSLLLQLQQRLDPTIEVLDSATTWGRVNQQEWYASGLSGNEELVAYGRSPSDFDEEAFSGVYNLHPLIIFDEATGMSYILADSAESLMSNENARFLALFNPLDRSTWAGDICQPDSGWNVITAGWETTPNYTGEIISDDEEEDKLIKSKLISKVWVDETIAKYGEGSPYVEARIWARFPETSEDGLVSPALVQLAVDNPVAVGNSGRRQLGVDVGAGGDENNVCLSDGPVSMIVRKDRVDDVMQTTGNIVADINTYNATHVVIDANGVGQGVDKRLKEIQREDNEQAAVDVRYQRSIPRGVKIYGLLPGWSIKTAIKELDLDPKSDLKFRNIRSSAAWAIRLLAQDKELSICESGGISSTDLQAQLSDIQYYRVSDGRIALETKEEYRKRRGESRRGGSLRQSPNDFDALTYSRIPVGMMVNVGKGVVGKKLRGRIRRAKRRRLMRR